MARTEAEREMQVPVANQSDSAIYSAWGPSDHLGVASDLTWVSASIPKVPREARYLDTNHI